MKTYVLILVVCATNAAHEKLWKDIKYNQSGSPVCRGDAFRYTLEPAEAIEIRCIGRRVDESGITVGVLDAKNYWAVLPDGSKDYRVLPVPGIQVLAIDHSFTNWLAFSDDEQFAATKSTWIRAGIVAGQELFVCRFGIYEIRPGLQWFTIGGLYIDGKCYANINNGVTIDFEILALNKLGIRLYDYDIGQIHLGSHRTPQSNMTSTSIQSDFAP